MKSQPEIKIRRLAVFGGYRDLEAPTAWRRPAHPYVADPPPRQQRPEITVITLEALPRTADLPVAA